MNINNENSVLIRLIKILPTEIRKIIQKINLDFNKLIEIRLRVNEPLIIVYDDGEYFIDKVGVLTNHFDNVYIVIPRDIKDTVDFISNYSLYAYEDELRQGFITIQGGHRVGLAGQVVLEDGKVKSVKHISFINIRVSHEIKGCAIKVLPYIMEEGKLLHSLIISPPGCGKTTLLRDVIRCISDGGSKFNGMTVGVVDERSEIAACYLGEPQNDIGIRTDILDCCPKAQGMLMLIRSMSPKVIAIDEIGNREDIEALSYVINSGCRIIATVHGDSIDDIRNKPILRKLVEEKVFDRYIVLGNSNGIGSVKCIFDKRGSDLYLDNKE